MSSEFRWDLEGAWRGAYLPVRSPTICRFSEFGGPTTLSTRCLVSEAVVVRS